MHRRIQDNEFYLEDTPREKNEKALSVRDLLLICEQKLLIQTVKERASGMTSKGIECLQLSAVRKLTAFSQPPVFLIPEVSDMLLPVEQLLGFINYQLAVILAHLADMGLGNGQAKDLRQPFIGFPL